MSIPACTNVGSLDPDFIAAMVNNQIPSFEDKAEALYYFPLWRTWFDLHGLCKIVWNDVPWREGLTVQDVLDHLKYSYALITLTLGNELVEPERYADTSVPDGCAMMVFHLAHGG